MLGCARSLFALSALLLASQTVPGQDAELPPPFVAKKPPSRQEVERRDALRKYVDGLLCEREERLLEALKAYEESARLDPEAPAVFKAQVGLLLGLDRATEAMAACQKALELDPGDPELWYVAARLHKVQGHFGEAQSALRKALATERAKDHPEQSQQLYLDLGELCEASQEYAQAADAYSRAAEILEHPDRILEKGNFSREAILIRTAETYERIGNLYRKAKKYDQAVAALRKAQERAPERAGRIGLHLAQLLQEQERFPEALTQLDAYLRLQPLGLEAYEMKIELMRRLGQDAILLPWLEQMAQADRHNAGLRLLLAREYSRARQTSRAERLYDELAKSGPTPEVYRGWFQLYKTDANRILNMLNQAVEQAMASGERPGSNLAATQGKAMVAALREEPELARALVHAAFKSIGTVELKHETLQFLALVADQQRLSDEAERFYRKCLAQAPPTTEPLVYGGLLRVLNRARKYEEVIKICEEGLAKARVTNRLLFYNDLARACAQLERYDEALRHLDQALVLAGDDNKLMFKTLRIRILAMAERYAQAETECQTLLKEHPLPGDALEIRYVLSGVYTASKQAEKAEEQLALILRMDPNNATANNDLGYVWADKGKNLPEAEEMIRKALEQDRRQRKSSTKLTTDEDKDNASYVDSLGWVLFRRGRLEEARQELERATALPDSEDPVIWDHLGDVYYRLRQTEQARWAWEKALRYYDQGRRRADERYQDLQRKLKMAKDQASAR